MKLERVEQTESEGTVLIVSGCDLLDNTPIFDIKPYIPFADSIPDAKGGYADEHREHKLEVVFPEELKKLVPEEKLAALTESLEDDPRPSYQSDPERIYGMRYAGLDVRFRVSDGKAEVVEINRAAH